ncbi:MAG TPA: acyl-CoA dehydrogenase family protein [Bryobacteraceae bacterium]|nr:acyl-CoA dehydrogenase family protein [Bryobacteraceae bacterium]
MEATKTVTTAAAAPGGGFLVEERKPQEVFTPEDLSEEQRQIAKTAAEFTLKEVLPRAAEIEAKNFAVTRGLLRKAGELGLMAADIPEAYGGLELDKVTSAVIAESMSMLGSFSVAFSGHTGIGTLPIVWYGTEEQKRKYLPKLATGEWIGAYALSESSSGSDALNCRTRAALSPDGKHWVLNGEKMWITNSGFADLFTVFAKVDGEKFSAFLVERNTPGFSVGHEEHKLGIRGSSTCPLILADCQIPVENLLGEIGKGHHIAFNILNIGRFKLGAACVGAARNSLQNGIQYAKERKAFGKSIAEFGLIQEKIAECAAGIYAGESLAYRTIGMIDAALAALDTKTSRDIQKRIEEYAVECSILKVWGSEMLDMVVDHVLQIFGGYGYVEEYPAERAYRDSRINRIFEGTNEINRLIIAGFLMKRAMAGQLPLLGAIQKLMDEVMSGSIQAEEREGPLAGEHRLLSSAKKLSLFAAGVASQKYMQALADQQEVMAALADCIIEVYAMESCLLRAEKLRAAQGAAARQAIAPAIQMTRFYAAKAIERVELAARKVIAAASEGDMLRTQLAILRRLSKYEPADTIGLGREIARHMLAAGRYAL